MKKIIYMLLAVAMCLTMSVTAAAETKSFPMTINTGVITFDNSTTINTNFAPAIPADDSIVIKINSEALIATKVTLVIEGERWNRNYTEKIKYDFSNYTDQDCTKKVDCGGLYWKLGLYADRAYANDFLVSAFSRIYSVTLVTEAFAETDNEQIYYDFGTRIKSFTLNPVFTVVRDFVSGTELTDVISEVVTTAKDFNYYGKDIYIDYPFLSSTDINNDGALGRTEVVRLSYSERGEGKGITGFEGLSSQVAEFFNQKFNGKIVFKTAIVPTVMNPNWANGGVQPIYTGVLAPKTTVTTNTLAGLFFDYDSTGSLVTTAEIANDGTMTFDISEILKEIDGNTVGVLRNIYYGLIGGINYDGIPVKGIKVEKVILSYEDEDGEEVETTIPVITDDEIEDEIDPDVDIIDIPEETTVATTTEADIVLEEDPVEEVIINAVESVEGEDENPRTGVALAIIPSLIAGVAIFTTKKRK